MSIFSFELCSVITLIIPLMFQLNTRVLSRRSDTASDIIDRVYERRSLLKLHEMEQVYKLTFISAVIIFLLAL